MPLEELADEIIRLSEHCASTPVLVTPSYLSLRLPFFAELAGALADKTGRPIRIDWCRPMPNCFSLIGDSFASARAARVNRALRSRLSGRRSTAALQLTSSIARPGGVRRDLVVGLCDHRVSLPPWTTAIRLGGTPDAPPFLQSVSG
jgi:hypothetical protein